MRNKIIGILIFSLGLSLLATGQVYTDETNQYKFLNTDSNHLAINNSKQMRLMFQKLESLVRGRNHKINVLHIGDSHVQADFFSHQMRKQMQSIALGQNGGRGFVFPYRMAKTNNPLNYKVDYSGDWQPCKNVKRKTNCEIGLGGISLSTHEECASFQIWFPEDKEPEYYFERVKVFHTCDTSIWSLRPADTTLEYTMEYHPEYGYTRYTFQELKDSIRFTLHQKKQAGNKANEYILHGLSLDNGDPGIVYHSAGVNGADVKSWLRCNLLQKHVSAIDPDLIIISLGTNDAYMQNFNEPKFKYDYRLLVEKLRAAAPEAAFLLTSPGDSYRYRRYLNRNIPKAVNLISDIADDQNMAFWNFYQVMGEMNSISQWHRAGLSSYDRLHLSRKGYQLQGKLLFTAFMKAFGDYIYSTTQLSDKDQMNTN
ncbi:MAG: GDSL-type esterase/lipase family protein [Bacteroidota bacterium]